MIWCDLASHVVFFINVVEQLSQNRFSLLPSKNQVSSNPIEVWLGTPGVSRQMNNDNRQDLHFYLCLQHCHLQVCTNPGLISKVGSPGFAASLLQYWHSSNTHTSKVLMIIELISLLICIFPAIYAPCYIFIVKLLLHSKLQLITKQQMYHSNLYEIGKPYKDLVYYINNIQGSLRIQNKMYSLCTIRIT